MSHNETTDSGRLEAGESVNAHLSRLAGLARQAFEQKRTKECLDLTRAILLIDPENSEAQWMRSSIQSEMQRDLDSVRAALLQAYSKDGESKPADASVAVTAPAAVLDLESANAPEAVSLKPRFRFSPRTSVRWLAQAAAFLAIAAMTIGIVKLIARSTLPDQRSTAAPATETAVAVAPPQPQPQPPTPAAPELRPPADILRSIVNAAPAAAAPRAPSPAPKPPRDAPVAPTLGTLAVSSSTPVDIYREGAFVGSTPVSLQLPAGMQTLEYRHAGLRKIVTHIIRSDETTKAMITFDVVLRLNSKPWAEVYLDGVDRRDLGQTPLGSVQVPIGSILSFENPQFPPKKYRVTGNETGIQIVFP